MTSTRVGLLLTLTAALLTGCGSTPVALNGNLPGQIAPRYDDLVTVALQSGDTRASVEAALGGTVLNWDTSGCAAGTAGTCQAMIGLNTPGTLSAQALGSALGRAVTVEPSPTAHREAETAKAHRG